MNILIDSLALRRNPADRAAVDRSRLPPGY